MLDVLIMGFGHAGRAYLNALNLRKNCKISIYDPFLKIKDDNLNFINELSETYTWNLVIICTPHNEHLTSLKKVIHHSKKIIIEKPPSAVKEEINEIMKIADWSKKIYFAYHAYFGKELLPSKLFNRETIGLDLHISHCFFDPYEGRDKERSLINPFWDGIYNVLSIYYRLFSEPIFERDIIHAKLETLCFNAIIKRKYINQVVLQKIRIHWDFSLNFKVSQIECGETGFTINHSQQCLSQIDGRDLYCEPLKQGRLEDHYSDALVDALTADNYQSNNNLTKKINLDVFSLIEELDSGA